VSPRPAGPAEYNGIFRTDDAARAVYAEAAGIGRIVPRAIAVPTSADDVATLIQWAGKEGHPIIARGSGSSMAGGAIGDGIVVDLSRLRALDEPDVEGRSIRAGAGMLRAEIQRRAARNGLGFAVDPSSGEFCTIGGMTATNAAGPHSLRYGAMRACVLAIECVFVDGSRATIRRGVKPPQDVAPVRRFIQTVHPEILQAQGSSVDRVLKNSSGYAIDVYRQTHELVDLLVGSEGTLALFTAVEVALTPAPAGAASLFVAFRDLEHAVQAAVASRESSSVSACELLDRTFLALAAEAGRPLPAPPESEAALLVDVEGMSPSHALEEAERLRDRFRSSGAVEAIVAAGSSHQAELWTLRHAASPAIAKLDPALRSMQFIEDAAVPPSALAAYVRGVRDILSRYDTRGVIFGHAGDAHVHVNPLIDTRRSDWRDRVEGILVAVTDLVAVLGGTLTGEHGDGRLRTPLLDRVWSADELRLFAGIKTAFDPSTVLNPGVKVPLHGQRAVDVIKYDPQLKRLPDTAAAALATVERERAYARHRLDLL
jgi:FAD/FMN-containing dehydrogenase